MALKFEELLTRHFPKGKIWSYPSPNLTAIKKGLAIEFNRIYEAITDFYNDFNILNSSNLAKLHAKDYFLDETIFTNDELQHIIVEYIYGSYTLKDLVIDFANFIGEPLEYIDTEPDIGFGVFEFGNEITGQFGDYRELGLMVIKLSLPLDISCDNYAKIKYIVDFFKPPYLRVLFENEPYCPINPEDFIFNTSLFGDRFGSSAIVEGY